MAQQLTVAVIGAGVAGLTTARALKAEGHLAVVYEKSDRIGGTWVYDSRVESDPLGIDPDREIVHSSLYHSLSTNLPRQLMGFLDYPFATKNYGDWNTFPGHQEVLEFLNQFAADFGLVDLIRFNTEVVRVERVELRNDKWVVESRTNELSSEEVFDAVVVCSGHYTLPIIANFPGRETWPGKQMHSHNYRIPEPFQDQIVVVIGHAPSALDISLEISKVAKKVHLSSRFPGTKVSKMESGDNMWQQLEIDHVDDSGEVTFKNGASICADIILHCTGYKYDFSFLKTNGIVTVDDNRVGPLYKHVFPPQLAPGLSFVGVAYKRAKWVARVLSGKASLPSEEDMLADVQQHYQCMEEKGIPKHHTHFLGLEFEYSDWVATQVGLPQGVDQHIKSINTSYFKFIADNGFWRNKEWQIGHGQHQGNGNVGSLI